MPFLPNFQFTYNQIIFISLLFLIIPIISTEIIKFNGIKNLFHTKHNIHSWIICALLSFIVYLLLNNMYLKTNIAPVLTKYADFDESPAISNRSWSRFNNNVSKWNVDELKKDNDGNYCPRGKKEDFQYRSAWLEKSIPVAIRDLKIRFIVKNVKKDYPVRVVISIGNVYSKEYKISNFYIPFDDSESVNFQKFDPTSKSMEWQSNPGELQLPIRNNTPVTVNINSSIVENTINYEYEINYIPAGEISSIQKTFLYSVAILDPSPDILVADFGIGVFHGGCLSDIEYLIN